MPHGCGLSEQFSKFGRIDVAQTLLSVLVRLGGSLQQISMFYGAMPGRRRRQRGASDREGDSASDDRSVVVAPRVKGVALESVPRLEAFELAGEIGPFRRVGGGHGLANLIPRSRHPPDAHGPAP